MPEHDARSYQGIPHWESIDAIIKWVERVRPMQSVGPHYAIKDLVTYGSDAVPRLIDRLLNSDRIRMKSVAVSALRQIGDRRALDALWTAYRDRDTFLWLEVLLAISDLKDARIFDELVALLPERSSYAIMGMGNLGDERAVPLLRSYVERQEERMRAMVHDVERNPARLADLDTLLETIKTLMRERGLIAGALGKIGGVESIQILAGIIHADDIRVRQFSMYDRVRCNAVMALGKIDHPQVFDVLRSGLTHRKYGVRRTSRRVLKKLSRNGGSAPHHPLTEG